MGITVQNITGNTAMVIWPKMASCVDSFYSIMYHPNWNSMLSSYSRKSFQKEERVPTTRSSFVVENLIPLTTYIMCVTCQSANPSSDQCRVFNTLERDPASASNTKKELALGIWLTSSVLLLIIAAVLLYGCLHLLCRRRRERLQEQNRTSKQEHREPWTKSCEFYPDNSSCFPNHTLQHDIQTTHFTAHSCPSLPSALRSVSKCKLNSPGF
uniref:Uncharacterized protein n=1 Tax=Corvus moneduloides TaxID=1196302 RepID=A0A8C3EYG1_CORMO